MFNRKETLLSVFEVDGKCSFFPKYEKKMLMVTYQNVKIVLPLKDESPVICRI